MNNPNTPHMTAADLAEEADILRDIAAHRLTNATTVVEALAELSDAEILALVEQCPPLKSALVHEVSRWYGVRQEAEARFAEMCAERRLRKWISLILLRGARLSVPEVSRNR